MVIDFCFCPYKDVTGPCVTIRSYAAIDIKYAEAMKTMVQVYKL